MLSLAQLMLVGGLITHSKWSQVTDSIQHFSTLLTTLTHSGHRPAHQKRTLISLTRTIWELQFLSHGQFNRSSRGSNHRSSDKESQPLLISACACGSALGLQFCTVLTRGILGDLHIYLQISHLGAATLWSLQSETSSLPKPGTLTQALSKNMLLSHIHLFVIEIHLERLHAVKWPGKGCK